MSEYQAPLRDMNFVINELAGLDTLTALPGYEDATPDMVEAILEQAGVLANEVFSPINYSGNEHGTFVEDGKVVSPPGFADAYRQFVENGWQGIGQPVEFGGQGLPFLVSSATAEMWYSSNMALALCPLLTSGAIEAIYRHGSEALKTGYLEKIVAGEWAGTMNLTEPQAGTDLAAVRTRAVPEGDHYLISGQKIFITWGEHEMSDNIVHLVLARLPDAPEGVKGISMFLVPKYLPNDDGSPGKRNDLQVVSVETKLGIHASPTCVMSYGDEGGATAYLVGEANKGLACMFTMMNHARLEVGMQGVGIAERAYQRGLAYAKERVQGNVPGIEGRVTIIHHPDVRRMLMQMRSLTEASRALAYVSAAEFDRAHKATSDREREKHRRRIDLLTPVAKAWSTEISQEVTSLGVQVHGGMGFIEETGAAQYLRDSRILTIYEGTTGIQGLDLMGRKIIRDKGVALADLIGEMSAFNLELESRGADLTAVAEPFSRSLKAFEEVSHWFLQEASNDADLAGSISVSYLMLMGYVVCGWLMAKSAVTAKQHLDAGAEDEFYRNKIKTATFYAEHILPRCEGLKYSVRAGSGSIMSIAIDDF
ncbi:MAG: acyl-CoA dehydrogenase [Gammaproteobacteria bacterium]|nr:acyl-CoA dehydrogenase [Gammaproteobacteria bacterium]